MSRVKRQFDHAQARSVFPQFQRWKRALSCSVLFVTLRSAFHSTVPRCSFSFLVWVCWHVGPLFSLKPCKAGTQAVAHVRHTGLCVLDRAKPVTYQHSTGLPLAVYGARYMELAPCWLLLTSAIYCCVEPVLDVAILCHENLC